MIAVDNHGAGEILRAEVPVIRHNTGLKGSMTINCGLKTCTIRVRSRTTNKVRATIRLRYRPARPHRTLIFEDYSGWVRDSQRPTQTWYVAVID